jgi:CRISPR-associated protein Cas1
LKQQISKLDTCQAVDEIRGVEGAGTKAYFAILRNAIFWQGEKVFEKRTRRPPKDPVNSLLSYGYALLTAAIFTACEVSGLDPYCGYLHSDAYGRPSLALDLMEEFRPLIVDSIVMRLVNHRMIGERHFQSTEAGACFLTKKGNRKFIEAFQQRLQTEIYHPMVGRNLSYQKCFEVQARMLRKVIEGKQDQYHALTVR